jgi:hypothetical protein
MKFWRLVATPALLAAAVVAHAQTMKPGLWEVSQKMQMGSTDMNKEMASMREQMAQMPPEQRKMMEDMMAKQGASMGAGGPGAMGVKMCVTKEMAERDEVSMGQGDCTSTRSPRVGNTMKIAFTCSKPPSSGEGVITFNGSDTYSMKMVMNTTIKGKTEKMDMDATGKWLNAECGSVKPLARHGESAKK